MKHLGTIMLIFLSGLMYAQQPVQKYIIAKVKAEYDAFPRGNFEAFDPYGMDFKVMEVFRGKIDSLSHDSILGLGYKYSKGEPSPNILKGNNYYIFLKDSVISYSPVYKIIGNMDTIEDPWFAPKKYVRTDPLYYPIDSSFWIFTGKEKQSAIKGTATKQITLNEKMSDYDLLVVTFDALKLKDQIEVITETGKEVLFSSGTFVSGKINFTILLKDIREDKILFKITSENKKSNWQITYKLVKLSPVPLKVFQEE